MAAPEKFEFEVPEMLKKILLAFTLGMFALSLSVMAQDKKIIKCDSSEKGGKHKLVFETRTLDERGTINSFIVVKPKNFNRDYMLQVARRLKSEYCNDNYLIVVIFDDRKLANSDSMRDYVNSDQKNIQMRGYYSFDKTTGKELLEFSTKLGNPTTEVYIDLSSKQ